jgi:Ca2+-binding RTX toxin-like protein
VSFYYCATAACSGTPDSLGSGTLNPSAKATLVTWSLPAGTDSLYAVYGGDTNFSGSTSPVISQVVTTPLATTTALSSWPNPSGLGKPVTLTATVTKSSGSATPTGTVSFYYCATAACSGTPDSLGSGTLNPSAKATLVTWSLPAGTDSLYAVYSGDTNFSGSTSPVISQVVNAPIATTTALSSWPNPSGLGKPVTLTATVTKSSGSGNLTGTVSFYLGTPSGSHSPAGTATLTSGQATLVTWSLPAGTDSLYAVYSGDTNFSGSTSPVISQVVVSLPSRCTGKYTNWFFGNPASPNITGTNGNDFIYAFGGNYRVKDFNGDDCSFYGGDGNNVLSDGNGNDVALAGDGNNVFTFGNGNDKIFVGNGTNTIGAGNGADSVTVGNGSHNGITLGNGTDSVTLGNGSHNGVALGSGTDVVTVQGGSHDTVNGGNGNETIYLGAGTYNNFDGATHHTNLCHLPAPPSSWHGTVAAYYHDTITNCTVVTP